jgi:hypothetical protein
MRNFTAVLSEAGSNLAKARWPHLAQPFLFWFGNQKGDGGMKKWQIFQTGVAMGPYSTDTWRVGRQIDSGQPLHGGNIEFTKGLYDTRDEAEKALSEALKSS